MFTFPDLINWYSEKQTSKLNDRRLIWWVAFIAFITGLLISLIFIWPSYPFDGHPFEVLYSEDGLPTLSLVISYLLASIQEDTQMELQRELISHIKYTAKWRGRLCPENIEALTIELIKHELMEEIKYPEIKAK